MDHLITNGTHVKTIRILSGTDFTVPNNRRPNAEGYVCGYSDSHGLCYKVIHVADELPAWYNPEELVPCRSTIAPIAIPSAIRRIIWNIK